MSELSTKPYLLRAIHEWCTDSGYTPYIAVSVDERTLVPADFVRAGEIVLNISLSATNRLSIGNELIEFQARFGGTAQDLSIPVDNVSAIYARENGHGMAFEVTRNALPEPAEPGETGADDAPSAEADVEPAGQKPTKSRPSLAAVPKSERSGDGVDPEAEQTPGARDDGPQLSTAGSDAEEASAETTGDDDAAGSAESSPGDGDGSTEKKPPRKRRGKPNLTRVK